jgi:GDP-4-dehydro-6-deoxy-D-mannose reductase
MTTALITGVAGFTGRHLAALLVSHGVRVFGVTRSAPPDHPALKDVDVVRADLLDRVRVCSIVDEIRPNYVFHLASDRASTDVIELMRRNLAATHHVLEAARRLPADLKVKVLVVGSAAEYGAAPAPFAPFSERDVARPISPYGVLKAAEVDLARMYAANHKLATFIARPFNLTGPGEPTSLVCSSMASQVAASERGRRAPVIDVGSLDAERDFVDVRDAVRAYWTIAIQGQPGEIYNVCSGRGTTIETVLRILTRLARVPLAHRVDPARVAPRAAMRCIGDPTRLNWETGWAPQIPLERSLADLLEQWRARYDERPVTAPTYISAEMRGALEVVTT